MKSKLIPLLLRLEGWRMSTLFAVGAVLGALLIVSIMDLILKGEVTADYLLTGLVTAGIVAPAVLALLSYLRQEIGRQQQDVLSERADRAEARLKVALESTDEGILMVARDGKVLSTSKRFLELWRVPQELADADQDAPILAHVLAQLVDPEDFLAQVRQLYDSDKEANGTLLLKDGRFFSHYTRVLSIESEYGRIWCFKDITEQAQAQAALAEREEIFRSIVTQANDAITLIDTETLGFVEFNDAACAALGYARDEFSRLAVPDIQAEMDAATLQRHFPPVVGAGVRNLETLHRHKNGSLRNVLVSLRGIDLHGHTYMVATWSDITERKQITDALRQREQYQRALLDSFPFMVWLKDEQSRFLAVNQAFATGFGWPSAQSLIGKSDLDIAPQDLVEAYRADDRAVLESGRPKNLEERIEIDGRRVWYETYKSPVSIDGCVIGTVGFARDISERKRAEEALHLAASVFTHAREGIMITAADGTIIDVNGAFTRITGYSRDDVLGQNPRMFNSGLHEKEYYAAMWRTLIEQGHWSGEVWSRRKNGELFAVMQTVSAVRDTEGETRQYVALYTDITVLKEHERKLEHIAHYDALTTLPNRVLLADYLHQGMAQAQRQGLQLAVAYIDLDGFKTINDRHGHQVGDQLLMTLATRMKRALREGDTLSRLGGDEFVVVLLDLVDIEACEPMLTRLLAAVAQPAYLGDLVLQVSASVGVTFYPQAEEMDADQLLRQADQAMYQAKLAGKNRYHVFDAEQDRSVRGHHESLEHIRRALTEHEFVLYYQPKVNLRTGTVIGAEALIRWQHPERGLLPPAVFLPVIEDHPLAVELGEWVIDTALTQMALWHAAGLDIPVSVNISARQLQQMDFVMRLRRILVAHPNIMPGSLELEVLETSALEDLVHVSQVIKACKEIGVKFALDDFGTGYSSLTYLKRLPVSTLKVDQSFVHDMLTDPDDLAIVEGVLSLATAFNRQVIAEGVETVEHGTMLLQLGCEMAQGYGIARPMPAHQLLGWCANWRLDPAWVDLPLALREDLPMLFARVEYQAWIVDFEAFLKGEQETPPQQDLHQCRFGAWLDSEGLARYGARPAFQALEQLHRQTHARASELLELAAQGRSTEALARLGELYGLRDAMIGQLQALARESWR